MLSTNQSPSALGPPPKALSEETSDEETHAILIRSPAISAHGIAGDRKFQTDAPRPSVPLRWLSVRSARGLPVRQSPSPGAFIGGVVCCSCKRLGTNSFQRKLSFCSCWCCSCYAWRQAEGRNASLLKVSGKQTKYVLRLNDDKRLHLYLGRERHPGNFQEDAEVGIYADHKCDL